MKHLLFFVFISISFVYSNGFPRDISSLYGNVYVKIGKVLSYDTQHLSHPGSRLSGYFKNAYLLANLDRYGHENARGNYGLRNRHDVYGISRKYDPELDDYIPIGFIDRKYRARPTHETRISDISPSYSNRLIQQHRYTAKPSYDVYHDINRLYKSQHTGRQENNYASKSYLESGFE